MSATSKSSRCSSVSSITSAVSITAVPATSRRTSLSSSTALPGTPQRFNSSSTIAVPATTRSPALRHESQFSPRSAPITPQRINPSSTITVPTTPGGPTLRHDIPFSHRAAPATPQQINRSPITAVPTTALNADALQVQDNNGNNNSNDSTFGEDNNHDNHDNDSALGEDDDDNDSAVGRDLSTYTESLHSSLRESEKENGRGYHTYCSGKYLFPDDEAEQDRLDLQHQMFLTTLGGRLNLAPTPASLQYVLDLGTGTGIWPTEFAENHPEALVIGIDLSPIQPELVPSNCKFEVTDYEDPWNFPYKFNFIHGRMLCCSYSDGKKLLQQAYDGLAPGGILELQDVYMPLCAQDATMHGTWLEKWVELFVEAMSQIGRDPSAPAKYEQWMQEIGFQGVTGTYFKWPQNQWPKDRRLKDLGKWNMWNMLQGILGFTARPFTQILGWSLDEVTVLLANVRKDIVNTKIHSHWPMVVVYGQKPFT